MKNGQPIKDFDLKNPKDVKHLISIGALPSDYKIPKSSFYQDLLDTAVSSDTQVEEKVKAFGITSEEIDSDEDLEEALKCSLEDDPFSLAAEIDAVNKNFRSDDDPELKEAVRLSLETAEHSRFLNVSELSSDDEIETIGFCKDSDSSSDFSLKSYSSVRLEEDPPVDLILNIAKAMLRPDKYVECLEALLLKDQEKLEEFENVAVVLSAIENQSAELFQLLKVPQKKLYKLVHEHFGERSYELLALYGGDVTAVLACDVKGIMKKFLSLALNETA